MTRVSILVLSALTLTACRTEVDDPDVTSSTATLKQVVAEGEDCFVMASTPGGDALLMGTPDACEQGAGLEGQIVTLRQKTTMIEVPLGAGTAEEPIELVVGIEAGG